MGMRHRQQPIGHERRRPAGARSTAKERRTLRRVVGGPRSAFPPSPLASRGRKPTLPAGAFPFLRHPLQLPLLDPRRQEVPEPRTHPGLMSEGRPALLHVDDRADHAPTHLRRPIGLAKANLGAYEKGHRDHNRMPAPARELPHRPIFHTYGARWASSLAADWRHATKGGSPSTSPDCRSCLGRRIGTDPTAAGRGGQIARTLSRTRKIGILSEGNFHHQLIRRTS
jgi:hypothetical protein